MDNFGGGNTESLLISSCGKPSAKPVTDPRASGPSVVTLSATAVTRALHAERWTAPLRLHDCCARVADLALVNSSK